MKFGRILIINVLITFALVETFSFIFFRQKVRLLYREYWSDPVAFGRGYPRYHFTKHSSRGFDISKNSEKVMVHRPTEISPYPVWGNSIGCFDKEIDKNEKYEVYLAGDSFTWGYAPFKDKFGTLLEERLDLNVAACGVTHTGQIHQFDKFKEISNQLGYFPKFVIVNVIRNDITNDFLHPQATIIDGYQVDIAKKVERFGSIEVLRLSESDLRIQLQREKKRNSTARFGIFDPKNYSATSVFIWFGSITLPSSIKNYICRQHKMPVCSPSRNVKFYPYPIKSQIAKKNRKAIIDWINHSKNNGYRLVFADLNTQVSETNYSLIDLKDKQEFCNFVESHSNECHSFVKYLVNNGILDWRKVRWKRDGHFNLRGNRIYSDFLEIIYKKSSG